MSIPDKGCINQVLIARNYDVIAGFPQVISILPEPVFFNDNLVVDAQPFPGSQIQDFKVGTRSRNPNLNLITEPLPCYHFQPSIIHRKAGTISGQLSGKTTGFQKLYDFRTGSPKSRTIFGQLSGKTTGFQKSSYDFRTGSPKARLDSCPVKLQVFKIRRTQVRVVRFPDSCPEISHLRQNYPFDDIEINRRSL